MNSDETLIMLCILYAFSFFSFGMIIRGWIEEDKQSKIVSLKKALSHAIKAADNWAWSRDGNGPDEEMDKYRELIK